MAQSRSETTKETLIKAAFFLFAEKGYEGASTREIAARAETNIASINYHFGGKAGLRLACAQAIVGQFKYLRDAPTSISLPDSLQEPQTEFEAAMLRQAVIILGIEQAQPLMRFLLREAHDKGEVFEYVYTHFFDPAFTYFYSLFLKATERDDTEVDREELKIAIFSVISMLAYFRIGEPVILRHQNWTAYEEKETNVILHVLQNNIRSIVANYRRNK